MPTGSSTASSSTGLSSPLTSPSASSAFPMAGHGHTPTPSDVSSPTRGSTKSKRSSGLATIISFLSFGRKRNKTRASSTSGPFPGRIQDASESSSTLGIGGPRALERDRRAFSIPQGAGDAGSRPFPNSSNALPGAWPRESPSPSKLDSSYAQTSGAQLILGRPQKILNNITMTVVQPAEPNMFPPGSRSRATTLSHPATSPPPRDDSWLNSPPPPIGSPPFGSTYLEPGGYGRSSMHSDKANNLPSSAATFGMPSTTSLKLPTPDTDDRLSSIAVYEDHNRSRMHMDDDQDAASFTYSQEWNSPDPPQPQNQGVPASFTSSYFSMSASVTPLTAFPPSSAFGTAPTMYPPRTRKSSAAESEKGVRRMPSAGSEKFRAAPPATSQRLRKASTASISPAQTVKEEDEPALRPQPSRPTMRASGSGTLSRPSMSAFGVNKSLFASEAASIGSHGATEDAHSRSRTTTPKPTPLVIPKSRSYGESLRGASPKDAALARSYSRAEKAKGKASPAEEDYGTIRRLPPVPPLPSRSATVPDPRVGAKIRPLPSSPETANSSASGTPNSSAFTSPSTAATSLSSPRRLPELPNPPRKNSRSLPKSKRSLPALPQSGP